MSDAFRLVGRSAFFIFSSPQPSRTFGESRIAEATSYVCKGMVSGFVRPRHYYCAIRNSRIRTIFVARQIEPFFSFITLDYALRWHFVDPLKATFVSGLYNWTVKLFLYSRARLERSILELLSTTMDELFSRRALITFGNTEMSERYKKGYYLYSTYIRVISSAHDGTKFSSLWKRKIKGRWRPLSWSKTTSISRWRNVSRFPSCINWDHLCRAFFSRSQCLGASFERISRRSDLEIAYERTGFGCALGHASCLCVHIRFTK